MSLNNVPVKTSLNQINCFSYEASIYLEDNLFLSLFEDATPVELAWLNTTVKRIY